MEGLSLLQLLLGFPSGLLFSHLHCCVLFRSPCVSDQWVGVCVSTLELSEPLFLVMGLCSISSWSGLGILFPPFAAFQGSLRGGFESHWLGDQHLPSHLSSFLFFYLAALRFEPRASR
jgi:hypothetical protein